MEFYRLDQVALGFRLPAIGMPITALGGIEGAAALGFEPFTAVTATRPVPETTLGADLHSPREVRLVLGGSEETGGAEPAVLVEVTFPDDHDPAWERAAHQGQAILVLASESDFGTTPTHQAAMDAWIALVPLIVRLYPEGVGTARPGG